MDIVEVGAKQSPPKIESLQARASRFPALRIQNDSPVKLGFLLTNGVSFLHGSEQSPRSVRPSR